MYIDLYRFIEQKEFHSKKDISKDLRALAVVLLVE